MDTQALKEAAIELRKHLELYKEKESAARLLYAEMENLISAAERGEINTQIEAGDIPGHRIMDESNLRGYRELSSAYSKFYVELIDGRDSDTLKTIQKIMEQVRA